MVPAILVKALSALPSLPPEVEPWLAPSGFLAGLALVLGLQGQRINELRSEMKASEDRQQKAMAELKADMRAGEVRQQQAMAELKADMQAGEARQQQAMAELKADNRAINEKLDRLIASLGKVQQG